MLPRSSAVNPGDAQVPDLGRLGQILRGAERRGTALPQKRHGLWVTEFAYDSSPPDPGGVPEVRRARWLAESMYLFWRQGADAAVWYLLRDQTVVPPDTYGTTYQGGLYFEDGRVKLSQQAYRFPFVTERLKGRVLRVWARPPARGNVRIQLRKHRRWRTLVTVRTRRANAVLLRNIWLRKPGTLRATVGSIASVPWKQED